SILLVLASTATDRDQVDLVRDASDRIRLVVRLVSRHLGWRVPEQLLVIAHDGLEEFVLARPAFEHGVAADELLVDLCQRDHVPELDRLASLAAFDELRVRLEDAVELLGRWHLFVGKDAAAGLITDSPTKGDEVTQLLGKFPSNACFEEVKSVVSDRLVE